MMSLEVHEAGVEREERRMDVEHATGPSLTEGGRYDPHEAHQEDAIHLQSEARLSTDPYTVRIGRRYFWLLETEGDSLQVRVRVRVRVGAC